MSIPANERILVTGGTGFIGSYVVNMLLSEGHKPLVTTFKASEQKASRLSSKIELIEIDLANAELTSDLIQQYKPQIVLHLAGVTGNADPTGKTYEQVNFHGTLNLLRPLEKYGVRHVIMLGSAAEYGDQPTPFREDMPAKPVSYYAKSKARANQAALEMYAASRFPVTVLRVFTAYGYDQPDKMFLSQVIKHAILNQHFKMSDGLQKRDFVFIEDVVTAIKMSMTAEKVIGQVINIGGGLGVALRHVAKRVWEICGADSDLLHLGAVAKSGDDRFDTEADISLAGEILNWKPGPGILDISDDYSRLRDMIERMKKQFR